MIEEYFEASLEKSNRVIYTASQFAKDNLLYLQETGELTATQTHISRRDYLDSYLFFMVESGSGKVVYNSETYNLSAGDCIFIDCKRPYAHESSNDLWHLKWIHFNGKVMPGIYDKYLTRGGKASFSLNKSNGADILNGKSAYHELWQNIFSLAKSTDHIKDMKINEQLSSLVTCLMQESVYPSENNEMGKGRLYDIKEFLDNNYDKKISLDMLSERFFINKYYLTRIFKEEYETTINNYLLSIRITKAKSMLRFSNDSVEEIGLTCGIGDSCYFSRKFKEIEGMSPREYRYRWR